jgi:hypothetical protein
VRKLRKRIKTAKETKARYHAEILDLFNDEPKLNAAPAASAVASVALELAASVVPIEIEDAVVAASLEHTTVTIEAEDAAPAETATVAAVPDGAYVVPTIFRRPHEACWDELELRVAMRPYELEDK